MCAWQTLTDRTDKAIGAVKPGSISGVIWLDENEDGARGEGELLMSGVSLELVDERGGAVSLTRIEFNILEALVRRPNRVFSKSELFELAWGEPFAGDDSTVAVHVSNIRSKLRETGTDDYIKTVWGMGFKLA